MNNKDVVIAFYTLVNRLYSINYTARRLAAQRKSKETAQNFKFDSKSPKDAWIDAKQNDIASLRREFFENYYQANSENDEYFRILDDEYETSKSTLMQIHNIFFETDMPFEEIFDGFICKSPEMFELLKIIDMQSFYTNDECLVSLANAYSEYKNNLFYHTITHAMKENIEQLSNDVNSYGAPAFYGGIIQSDTLTTISAAKIKEYRKKLETQYATIKKLRVPKKDPTWLLKYNAAVAKYFEADVFLVQLEERLKAANTDVINTFSNKIVEGTLDFLTGAKTDEKTVVDKVYATRLELNYLEYAIKMFGVGLEGFHAYINNPNAQQKS